MGTPQAISGALMLSLEQRRKFLRGNGKKHALGSL
jgi:hypothetical protein